MDSVVIIYIGFHAAQMNDDERLPRLLFPVIVCFPVDFISSFVSKSGPSLLETTLFNFGE